MTAKHTPGPWSDKRGFSVLSPTERIIADVYSGGGLATRDADVSMRRANAALIAAAPDLLAACDAIMEATSGNRLDRFARMSAAISTARLAISRARGAS